MQATFLQKVMLSVVAGFAAACLIWFYRDIIQRADNEINRDWRNNMGQSSPAPAPR